MTIEMNCKLPQTLGEIADLFRANRNVTQAQRFDNLRLRAENCTSQDDRIDLARAILGLYGGMSSLNDYVIVENGIPNLPANRKLDRLRTRLYNEAINLRTESP